MMFDQYRSLTKIMLPAVEQEMQTVLQLDPQAPSDAFFGMLHYHMGWVDASLDQVASNGGKRIRPILCLLSCQAAGGDWQAALPAGAAIELLHNFTLIHDDIEDSSPTRRGRATVWKLWGLPQAINIGDSLFALSYLALLRLSERGVPAGTVVQAIRRFGETSLHLTNGQYFDMDFETRGVVTVDEYITMIEGKTAALLSLCCELGALVAGRDADSVHHFRQFGRDLGLAFQVKDDILGIWGDEAVIGKSAATDIETRKKTLPVLYGLAQSAALRELYRQPENDPEFVPRVVTLLEASGAQEFAQAQASHYSQSALNHLAATRPGAEASQALEQLAALLLERQA